MQVWQHGVALPHPLTLSVPFGIRVRHKMAPVRLAFARFAPVRFAPPRLQLGQAEFCSALDALRSHLARLALGPTMQGEPG